MINHNDNPLSYIKIVGVIFVLLLTIFTMLYWSMPDNQIMKLGTYIQSITVIILIATTILSIITFKNQIDDRNRSVSMQYANITQNHINDIDKMFMNNRLLDRLYFEMYNHNPHVKNSYKHTNITQDMLKQEHHMSNIIFQKIADIYFCEQLDQIEQNSINYNQNSIEWINTFKSWFKSPTLQSHWLHVKHEHHPLVRKFIDNIIITHKYD